MPTLYMMIGVPASGKSTIAAQLSAAIGGYIVSSDQIEEQFPNWSGKHKVIFSYAEYLAKKALLSGQSVIFDATNVHQEWRRPMLAIARRLCCPVTAVVVDAPLEICLTRYPLRRACRRQAGLTDEVVTKMAELLAAYPPSLDEGFDQVVVVQYNDPDPIHKIL